SVVNANRLVRTRSRVSSVHWPSRTCAAASPSELTSGPLPSSGTRNARARNSTSAGPGTSATARGAGAAPAARAASAAAGGAVTAPATGPSSCIRGLSLRWTPFGRSGAVRDRLRPRRWGGGQRRRAGAQLCVMDPRQVERRPREVPGLQLGARHIPPLPQRELVDHAIGRRQRRAPALPDQARDPLDVEE